jgi:UDP-3-O-[3-hydroxymyristoyl] N-acetylglucosamine deacetylase
MTQDHFASPTGYRVQKTLNRPVFFEGVGIHSGKITRIECFPAEPNHGVVFQRKDLSQAPPLFAHYDAVISTSMATSLGYDSFPDARIGTVEHLMAAFFALGVTNVFVEVTGPEIPILDGSASPFLEMILEVGLKLQPASTAVLKILKPIKIYENGAVCELLPREQLRLTTSIDFPHPSIGLQTFALEVTPKAFSEEICQARTFGFLRDVEKLRSLQLAQGASLENVLAFSETEVLNPGGMRYADECVRHKLLDALGDLALCGSWIEGEMVSYRGGHSIHLALLKSLKNFKSHWELIPAAPLRSVAYEAPAASLRLRH